MYLAYLDGLDSIIELLVPGAKEYPVSLVLYSAILLATVTTPFGILANLLVVVIRLWREKDSKSK
jgi:hypothetical protein